MPIFHDRRTGTIHSLVNGVPTDETTRRREPGSGKAENKPFDPARVNAYFSLMAQIFKDNPQDVERLENGAAFWAANPPDIADESTAFTPDGETPHVSGPSRDAVEGDDNADYGVETDNDTIDSGDWNSNV